MDQQNSAAGRQSDTMLYQRPLRAEDSEIRLLTVQPSARLADTVECHLSIVRLDEDPEYLALSYCWGEPRDKDLISINHHSVSVGRNLATALRHLRHATLPKVLWADALCIDQGNTPEKNEQVRKMGLIYKNAFKILSWLGVAADNSDLAIDMLQRIADKIEPHAGQGDLSTAPLNATSGSSQDLETQQRDSITPSENPEEHLKDPTVMKRLSNIEELFMIDDTTVSGNYFGNKAWEAIHCLLSRPYWERLWIRQEMVLAKDLILHCGTKSISWRHLQLAVREGIPACASPAGRSYFNDAVWPAPLRMTRGPVIAVDTIRRWLTPKQSSIYDLMPWALELKAQNPRDYVYGLLGMAESDMLPDYDERVEILYHRHGILWYRWATQKKVACEPIQLAGIGYHQCSVLEADSLPSWIPHLSCMKDTMNGWTVIENHRGVKSARESSPRIEDGDEWTLRVLGGTMDEVSEVWLVPQHPQGSDWKISSLADTILSFDPAWMYPTKMPLLQVLFRTLLCDADTQYQRPSVSSPSSQDLLAGFLMAILAPRMSQYQVDIGEFLAFQRALQHRGLSHENFWPRFLGTERETDFDHLPSLMQLISKGTSNIANFLQLAGERINSRCVFRTARGYLGIGPPLLQQKDMLVLFPSFTTPFLLRQSGSGRILVGNCFVLGLMNSELNGHFHRWNGPLQEFKLR